MFTIFGRPEAHHNWIPTNFRKLEIKKGLDLGSSLQIMQNSS